MIYRVTFNNTDWCECLIEAHSKIEAEEKARDACLHRFNSGSGVQYHDGGRYEFSEITESYKTMEEAKSETDLSLYKSIYELKE
ncbi:MAG: hypothetical protein WC248_04550 [Candidatus Methanomethylophilaceae archaeon]|jgi:hypothetical protein